MPVSGLSKFLSDYPGMALRPSRTGAAALIEGRFSFAANDDIVDSYTLKIVIGQQFPREVPQVTETGGKIPRNGDFHVNPDNTLCLGSPLRLKTILAEAPDLVTFAERCLVPYLYRVSAKLQRSDPLIGLEHGTPGIIDDYCEMFGLTSSHEVLEALHLLAMKKRIANKRPCPCGCGRRLGVCTLHDRLNAFRRVAPRSWFAGHARKIGTATPGGV
jgi:hypothetical protein